jgi:hypothetical protein
MSGEVVRKFKWNFVWEDDKEEAWLREHAQQGLHLVGANALGLHRFVRGAPQDVVYRLDYIPQARRDEHYYQLFRDAGWEHVLQCHGWQYWRKPASAGATEIFSDNRSKADMYRRVLALLIASALPSFVILVNPALVTPGRFSSPWSYPAATGLLGGVVALLGYGAVKVALRIRALRSGMP